MDSNFWWYFPSARPKEHWLVLATIRDDTWNVFNMQYIDQFKKKIGLLRHLMWWWFGMIKGSAHTFEVVRSKKNIWNVARKMATILFRSHRVKGFCYFVWLRHRWCCYSMPVGLWSSSKHSNIIFPHLQKTLEHCYHCCRLYHGGYQEKKTLLKVTGSVFYLIWYPVAFISPGIDPVPSNCIVHNSTCIRNGAQLSNLSSAVQYTHAMCTYFTLGRGSL